MMARMEVQEREFAAEAGGDAATWHRREVGASCVDRIATAAFAGESSTLALAGSTESGQPRA